MLGLTHIKVKFRWDKCFPWFGFNKGHLIESQEMDNISYFKPYVHL